MPNIINFPNALEEQKDDMIPMDEWDGSCWKTMFDTLAELAPNVDPWDLLAAFIKQTLMKGDNNG